MKITVLDGYAANKNDISWEPMRALGELMVYDRTLPNETISHIADSEIVLSNKVLITKEVIDACPNIKYIGIIATGTNMVDMEAATNRGIVVTNVPGYSTMAVAQLCMAFILEMADGVGEHTNSVMSGTWQNHTDFCYWLKPIVELSGKKLGIIGYGSIGRALSKMAESFGLQVKGYSPSKNTHEEFMQIIKESDIISLNCPLKDNNRGFINKELICQMKKGAWLINTARGPLVNQQDVADALNCGQLGYYAADVVDVEPIRADNPLLKAKNVYMTPHMGWAAYEARVRLQNTITQNVKAFIEGSPVNVVNK